MQYSASTVPILQLSLGSNTLPEQQLFDITNNYLRSDLATVQGPFQRVQDYMTAHCADAGGSTLPAPSTGPAIEFWALKRPGSRDCSRISGPML